MKKVIDGLLVKQRQFFNTGETREFSYRRKQLLSLRELIHSNEGKILSALRQDLRKPALEAYVGEIGPLYQEINHVLKRLAKWMKPRRAPTPVFQWFGSSWIYPEPLGIVLVIGPWNYPFLLILSPLIGALAAGNCAVVKPSEMAPETSHLIAELLKSRMDPRLVACLEGGSDVSSDLLSEKFDHVFFTGGSRVGKIVMKAAAEHLTPVTLELGGKSPCLVDVRADLATAARRIAWGKFFNAGQTCVAPDYVLVDSRVESRLLELLSSAVDDFFGPDPAESPDYARIVNREHFERVVRLLESGGRLVKGGVSDKQSRYVAPTIIADVSFDSPLMGEEIFGPILPVLSYQHLDDAIQFVKSRPKPLALYLFTSEREKQARVVSELSFGGACLNDTIIHLANPHLPFGGVGDSGMGAYHGRHSFDTFSHYKSVVRKSFFPDPSFRYPPYANHLELLRKLLR